MTAINDANPTPGGPIAVIGPGTGLGEVQLFYDSGYQGYVAWASEGSHAGFAPRGELQRELLAFAEEELEMPCEVEHVACGVGLQRIYRFLCIKRGVGTASLVRSYIV
jgi:glucokinase